MSKPSVSIKNLVKRYGSFEALKGISLDVYQGEVFGLLGPNGAGKTTTFECLEGLRTIDGGTVLVAGLSPTSKGLYNKLGVQLQSSSLPENILCKEALELVCAFAKVPLQSHLIQKFQIEGLLHKQYKQLSTGQKRRLHLVLALVNNPEILILDEPTAGLDVQSRAQLHDEIRAIKQQGVTVLVATHDMAEAELLCDRIAILINGKVAVCGTPEVVTAAGSKKTRIRLRTTKPAPSLKQDLPGSEFIREKDGYLEWHCSDVTSCVSDLLHKIKDLGNSIEDLRVERPSLEERFLELVEGSEQR